MTRKGSVAALGVVCALAFAGGVYARQVAPVRLGSSTGLDGLLASTLLFTAADANKDGAVTAAELKTAIGKWFVDADAAKSGAVTREQLTPVLDAAMPASGLAALMGGGRGAGQLQTPDPA